MIRKSIENAIKEKRAIISKSKLETAKLSGMLEGIAMVVSLINEVGSES